MGKLKVFVFASSETIGNFQKYNDEKNIEIAATAYTAEAFLRLPFTGGIAVVDTTCAVNAVTSGIIDFLSENKHKFFVICANVQEGFQYMYKGALDMFVFADELAAQENIARLCVRIRNAHDKHIQNSVRELKYTGASISDKVILIGASTGGAETVSAIMQELPANVPPIVIVQHMPPVFTKMYAERLNKECAMSVWEASDGDLLVSGLALVAPGGYQARVGRKDGKLCVFCTDEEKVSGHCPSVDVLFSSGAKVLGSKAIGVILTGMNADGAQGMLEMRKAGAYTIGQDEESCVVYGMPKEAFKLGGVCKQLHLRDIPRGIMENLR